jgi:hypothetical protein
MNICLCGTQAGYPHKPECPYPLYRGTDAMYEAWDKARDARVNAERKEAR